MADDKLDTGDKEKLAKAEKQFAQLEHAMRIIKNRLWNLIYQQQIVLYVQKKV